MEEAYKNCRLFKDLTEEQIDSLIITSSSIVRKYDKGSLVFDQYEKPAFMYVLLEGKIAVGKDYMDGRESFMTSFEKPGDIFGEILLFLDSDYYDFYARAETPSRVLAIPRTFLTNENGRENALQHQLITNTMTVFAQKAYFLQRRVQVLSLNSLRKRLAKAILFESEKDLEKPLRMPRESLAGYVNAARPSVSRELSAMERDGLIRLLDNKIYILNREKLEEISQ